MDRGVGRGWKVTGGEGKRIEDYRIRLARGTTSAMQGRSGSTPHASALCAASEASWPTTHFVQREHGLWGGGCWGSEWKRLHSSRRHCT
eukprot:353128-Chlamydomonas_euryale.AAC.2